MEILVSVGAGLIGTLVGAGIAWFVSRKQHRLETVFAIHREFHAPEMTRSRNLAGKTVRDHQSESFDAMRRKLSPQETQYVWNVMYFYQRLWLAIKFKSIHESYVSEMFGENFCWWYIKSYRDQLVPLDWQASRHIAALMRWIERHADQTELDRWRSRAVAMGDPRLEEPDRMGSAEGSGRPGRLIFDSTPQSGHGQESSKRPLDPIFKAISRILKQPALTLILFTFLVAKVVWVARGDVTTALGVYESAGLTTVIVGGLLSAMPLVAAGVLGIAIFGLIVQSEVRVFGLVLLAAAGACFFLATLEIMLIIVSLGVIAGILAKYGKFTRGWAIVVALLFFIVSLFLIVQPIMYAVWLPHETLVLNEGHNSPEVGYVLDNSNGWLSLLRTRSRRIVRIPSDLVTRRSLCHVKIVAGSVRPFDNPITAWQFVNSVGRRRPYSPSGTEVCPRGQSGAPSTAG
jgi:hypothetical protein